jgi:hypothetical protein
MRGKFPLITAAVLGLWSLVLALDYAHAQEPVPFVNRVGVVAAAGVGQWDPNTASALGHATEMSLLGGVVVSTGRMIQLVATENFMASSKVGMFEPGLRAIVVGEGNGQYSQLAIGAGGVYYHGGGVADPHWDWNAGLYGSYNILGVPGKALRWYISPAVIVDPNAEGDNAESKIRYRIDVRAVGIPAKF